MEENNIRNQLIDFLKKELIGPDPVSPFVQGNGEEFLHEPPRMRYGAGILYPQETLNDLIDTNDHTETEMLSHGESYPGVSLPDTQIEGEEHSLGGPDDNADTNDDTVNLANSFLPSAMGFSCFLDIPDGGFKVEISAGRYKTGEITVGETEPVTKKGYLRESLTTIKYISRSEIPDRHHRARNFPVIKNGKETGLVLNVRNRTTKAADNITQFFTFTLVNCLRSTNNRISNEDCFFQVEFSVRAKDDSFCFRPYPVKVSGSNNVDAKSIRLLYRSHKTFAIGHGCSPSWETTDDRNSAFIIKSDILPVYDLKPVLPTQFPDLKLMMYEMSDYGDQDLLTVYLTALCHKYERWIEKQEFFASENLTGELKETAKNHIINCRKCLERMREGIELINLDPFIKRAFTYMNRAMLMQQLRYGLKLREWKKIDDRTVIIDRIVYPNVHKRKSWPDWPEQKLGAWRPFQIAFILMNLKSMARSEDEQRKIVDIIWFPTGGGKTEAYLGLTAFTIFLKRLRNKSDTGTTVLMRYTLRLLTAQQFQRAASLICACDIIRKEYEDDLGSDRISIGLWVGQGLTPNKRSDAVRAFNEMEKGISKENPFIILKCPWCGVQMGAVKTDSITHVKGYKKRLKPSTVLFQCSNSDCDFSGDKFNLPLQVIDEEIYDSPPTLLIGTVDKFAMLPWRPEAGSLFGFRGNRRVSPPELIIQDELHLISGPIGSMVGHYETLISELCLNHSTGISPKIIASTATISRAKEQGHALYNCGRENVFQFPPQCINAGESFFAYEDRKAKGRMYAGIHASGLPSHATTQVRVISTILQGAKLAKVSDESERNYYWTILNYFNSLRELGHAATLIRADIREYLNALWIRNGIRKEGDNDPRRFINKAIELTSRISNTEIPQQLQALEIDYPPKDNRYPVDICLATNMISVGVDVSRLGLMTVVGQPKTTSEYIQSTSRVGRSKDGPGLVLVIYNTAKPRDRSHYEHFYSYHSTIYSQVEPTSVTPFSSPVRERALHAILVGYIRFFGNVSNKNCPQPLPSNRLFDEIKNIIHNRIFKVDPDEIIPTLKLLEERIDEWSRYLPPKYGDFAPPTPETPLMYPAGKTPHEDWNDKSWPTPSSMRDVDVSCEARVISGYSTVEES